MVSSAERCDDPVPLRPNGRSTPLTASTTAVCSASIDPPDPCIAAATAATAASSSSAPSPTSSETTFKTSSASPSYARTSSISLAASARRRARSSRSSLARHRWPRAPAWILAAARCSSSARSASLRGDAASERSDRGVRTMTSAAASVPASPPNRASSGKESSGESYPDPAPPRSRAASSTSDNVGSLIRLSSGLAAAAPRVVDPPTAPPTAAPPSALSPTPNEPPRPPAPSDGVNPGVLSALPIPPNAAGDVTCRPNGRPM
mmetsp:Transcript_7477/g.34073  ORF Transcript_7477/g.34073 Transcript_7477/m.34073 type:complete len:263 (+) Transcript_7477:1042-1830(+)